MMQAKAAKWRQCSGSPSTVTMNPPKISSAMASCATLSCPADQPWAKPMRLAGTAKQYSTSAMPQLIRMTTTSGLVIPPFRCQYQATVMKRFEMTRRAMVGMNGLEQGRGNRTATTGRGSARA